MFLYTYFNYPDCKFVVEDVTTPLSATSGRMSFEISAEGKAYYVYYIGMADTTLIFRKDCHPVFSS